MEQFISEYWGPILAVGILAAFILPVWIRLRREAQEDRRTCGPGCICAGENRAEAHQNVTVYVQNPQPNYQQQPQIVYLQAPQAPQQPQAPQVIYLQAPQQAQQQPVYLPEQPIYLQAPPQDQRQVQYLPAPQYQPQHHYPAQQAPQSYYAGPEADYPQEVYYLPPSQPVGQLPPASAREVDEARRRLEKQRR
jgi:hypothetical protein